MIDLPSENARTLRSGQYLDYVKFFVKDANGANERSTSCVHRESPKSCFPPCENPDGLPLNSGGSEFTEDVEVDLGGRAVHGFFGRTGNWMDSMGFLAFRNE